MRRKSGRLLCFAARTVLVAAALAVAPAVACAQQYPSMDIRLICAFPAGSGADVLVRYFAEKLRPIAGRTIIVENKTGAMGNIATEYVARARPDGHTVYVHAGSGVAANMHLFKKPPVDAAKAIRIAATINRQPYMLVVAAKSPIKTVSELTAAMKVKKEKASYATTNPITTVMGRLYKEIAGVQAVEVTYRTAPDSLNDITSGAVDYAVLDPVFSLSQQRAGRLRILAVSSGARLAANPDLPTMTESGAAMDFTGWWAAMVPAGTPKPVVDQLNAWFVQIVQSAETKAFLNKFGGDPFINTPEQAQALLEKDIKEWGEHVRIAKIVPQG